MLLTKCGPEVALFINDLETYRWVDDGKSYGDVLEGGKIGFRQMAPSVIEYSNLVVRKCKKG